MSVALLMMVAMAGSASAFTLTIYVFHDDNYNSIWDFGETIYPQAGFLDHSSSGPGSLFQPDQTTGIITITGLTGAHSIYFPSRPSTDSFTSPPGYESLFTQGKSWPVTLDSDKTVYFGINTAKTDLGVSMTRQALVAGMTDQLAYTIVVTNYGTLAGDASLTDNLPTGVTNARYSSDGGTTKYIWYSPFGLGNMVSGSSRTINIYVDVPADITTIGSNTATATSPNTEPSPDSHSNSASATATINTRSDIGITMTSQALIACQQDQLAYTITVTNYGPSVARSASLADSLPTGLSNAKYTLDGGNTKIAWSSPLAIGNMDPGASHVIDIYADISSGLTTIDSNTATVSSSTVEPSPDTDHPNSATASISVTEQSDLGVAIADQALVAGLPDQMAYTITVTNHGPSIARSVSLVDVFPDGLSNIKYTIDSETAKTAWSGSLALNDMNSGSSHTISIYADVPEDIASIGPNTAAASSSTSEPSLDPHPNSASATDTINKVSDLDTAITGYNLMAGQQNQLAYTITVTNHGPSVAGSVSLSDSLSTGLTNAKYTLDSGTTKQDWSSPLNLGDMNSGSTHAVKIYADVSASLTSLGQNTATVSSSTNEPNPDPHSNSASATATINTRSDLGITMTGHALIACVQGPLTYTITVTNYGPSVARSVGLADALPTGLSNAKYTLDGGNTKIAWSSPLALGNMDPGASHVIDIYADISSGFATIDSNMATVSTSTAEPSPDTDHPNSATASISVTEQSDLGVAIAGQALVAGLPDQMAYTITVTNNGPCTAGSVGLADVFPDGLSNIKYTLDSGTTKTDWSGSLDLNDMNSGSSHTIKIYADVPEDIASIGSNTATVSSSTSEPSPDPHPNSASATDTINTVSDLDTAITGYNLMAGQQNQLAYTITVTNHGPSVAASVSLSDSLSTGLTNAKYTLDSGTTKQDWSSPLNLGDMNSGSTHTVKIYADVSASLTSLGQNTATVSSSANEPNPDPHSNSASATATITTQADLCVAITGYTLMAGLQDQRAYTITLTNYGPSVAGSVNLADNLPAGLTNAKYTLDSGTTKATWSSPLDLHSMNPETSHTIVIYADVPAIVTALASNTATATSSTAEPSPDTDHPNSAGADDTVITESDLTIGMTGQTLMAGRPDLLAYTITVTNNGPGVARSVSLADTLPSGLKNAKFIRDTGTTKTAWASPLSLGNMDPGTSHTVKIYADVSEDITSLGTNTATASSSTRDPDTSSNTAGIVDVVTTEADLGIANAGRTLTAGLTDQLAYTITVTNNGPSTARSVSLADTLPTGLVNIKYTLDSSTDKIAWIGPLDLGDMGPSSSHTLKIYADAPSDLTDLGSNTATASSSTSEPAPDPHANSASAAGALSIQADLEIAKECSQLITSRTDCRAFTITVTNHGPSLAKSVSLADTLPGSLTNCKYTLDSDPAKNSWSSPLSLGNINPGSSHAVNIFADVPSGLTTISENTVTVSSPTSDPGVYPNTAACTNEIVSGELVISGFCFQDKNSNGVKDSFETGLAGWTINLKKTDGSEITTTTESDGSYIFDQLSPGTYAVTEVLQSGWTQTASRHVVALTGTNAADINFGNVAGRSISGTVFLDQNGNGLREDSESGLSGWTINLKKSDGSVTTTTTGADGYYMFARLMPGACEVSVAMQPGYDRMAPGSVSYPVNLADASVTGRDFGCRGKLSISGLLFKDTNMNGLPDSGEPALSGWIINLKKPDGSDMSITSGSDGTYRFDNLEPGTYTLTGNLQIGWTETAPTADSYTVTLTDSSVSDLNFGRMTGLSISGVKFNDLDGDSVRDSNEPGLAGWTINLVGAASMETRADGSYSFTNLAPGTYTVTESGKPEWAQTAPTSGSYSVMLTDSSVIGRDFGNWKQMAVSGRVYSKDDNQGLAGWTVRLKRTGNSEVSSTTGSDGSFSFSALSPGKYTLAEDLQPGWSAGDPLSGSRSIELTDSDLSGQDFGNIPGLSISGQKFNDLDGDGVKDDGETGMAGWTINLAGPKTAAAITDANGNYQLQGLAPGVYAVTENLQPGWTQTCPAGGSYSVDLTAGLSAIGKDFGNKGSLSVSGIKFNDYDANGQMDTGVEPPLQGWTIYLQNADGSAAKSPVVTDGNGAYSFHDLCPGNTYILREESQSGWVQTAPQDGYFEFTPEGSDLTGLNFGNRIPVPGMEVKSSVSNSTLSQGSQASLLVDITYSNSEGLERLDALRVVDILPAGLTFVSSTPPPDEIISNADGTTTLIWNNLMASGQVAASSGEMVTGTAFAPTVYSASIDIVVTISGDGSLVNSVTATGFSANTQISATDGDSISISSLPALMGITKTASSNVAAPGAIVNYTITYSNLNTIPMTNVVITEKYPQGAIFVDASPAPDTGTENRWTVGTLDPKSTGTIFLSLKFPDASDIRYYGSGRETGSGFVNVYRKMQTGQEAYSLTNVATLSCAETDDVSSSATVTVGEVQGTGLTQTNHGSGQYAHSDLERILTKNKSIEVSSSLTARYHPTFFSLAKGRSMNFTSRWFQADLAQNKRTGASLNERLMYADSIDLESRISLDENQSVLATDAQFQGYGHLGALKKQDPESIPKKAATFEGSESYAGRFRVNETIEDYGSNVISNKSASGTGFVSSDKRIRQSQRTYEYGEGSYQSEELIRTPESYIAKEVKAQSSPARWVSNSPGAGSFSSKAAPGSSMKWVEGTYSKNRGVSVLGQQISNADNLQTKTIAGGLNDLETEANYTGKGTFRAVLQDKVDLAEEYSGEYQLKRKIHLGGVSTYDMPHLTLKKSGRVVYNSIFNTVTVSYTITVLNDGNTALGPVYVKDLFPVDTQYINSSVKPYKLATNLANWSFLYMPIGQSIDINLNLNVTDENDLMINRVYALGYDDGKPVVASNFTVLQSANLPCCQQEAMAYKIARIDPGDPHVVWYRLGIKNNLNAPMVARVTDTLPTGMTFMNSSLMPESIPYTLSWVLTNIPPGKIGIIDYRTVAESGYRFVNTAHIDAYAVDGSGSISTDVGTAITVENLTSLNLPGGWKPPDWGLDQSDNICACDVDWSSSSQSSLSCASCLPDDIP